jgi:DNA mismatch endonuclease (patch repair protein)
MSLILKRDTKPEIVVRRLAHGLGFRFRLHKRDLPGTPDLVFPRFRKIIDVRGCFWHSHKCRRNKPPVATRTEYWQPNLVRNRKRDSTNLRKLQRDGWEVLVIWECETRDVENLHLRIEQFLCA